MARKVSAWLLVAFCALLVGCDHATKLAASSALRERPLAVVPGVLDLVYTENHDVAFSLLRGAPVPHRPAVLLAIAALGVLAVGAVWFARRGAASRLEHLGWSLVLAGAAGNFADRALRGFVVDFIHVRWWPVFNVADVAIVLGAFALVFARRSA